MQMHHTPRSFATNSALSSLNHQRYAQNRCGQRPTNEVDFNNDVNLSLNQLLAKVLRNQVDILANQRDIIRAQRHDSVRFLMSEIYILVSHKVLTK